MTGTPLVLSVGTGYWAGSGRPKAAAADGTVLVVGVAEESDGDSDTPADDDSVVADDTVVETAGSVAGVDAVNG